MNEVEALDAKFIGKDTLREFTGQKTLVEVTDSVFKGFVGELGSDLFRRLTDMLCSVQNDPRVAQRDSHRPEMASQWQSSPRVLLTSADYLVK